MEIKVCGLTQEANIREILELGVDYIGLIFYPFSKRCLQPDPSLSSFLKGVNGVKKVGVFVNESASQVSEYVEQYELDVVQLHGAESPGYCWRAGAGVQVWKAFQVGATFDFEQLNDYAPYCTRFLFDAPGPGYGGTGNSFDWSLLDHQKIALPFMLSGGIGLDDVEKVNAIKHPGFKGIDLNSRFEITPGWKDTDLLKKFIYAIRN